MADLATLDRAFHHIMRSFIDTGRAPHYTETAAALGVSVEEGRQLFRDLEATGYSFFLHPRPTRSSRWPRLTICPTNTALPSTGSRNGSPSEGLKRWQFAGYSRERR